MIASDADPPIAGIVREDVPDDAWRDATLEQVLLFSEYGREKYEAVSSEGAAAWNVANDGLKISPAEAAELLLDTEFNIEKDDESVQDKELRQARQLVRMVVDSDEFHLHESGDVFIEDLTDYVPAWIVASDAEPPIAGVVFDEVEEGEWCDATPEQTILASEYGPERFETVTSDAQMAREAANAEVVIDPDEAREYSVAAEFVTGMDPGRRTTHPERTLVGPSR